VLTARVDDASSFAGDPTTLFVGIYADDDRFVAVDFDGTLTKSPGLTLPFEDAKPPIPQPGAADTLSEIGKSFHVLYVTSRDERSMESVKSWLRTNGFPAGATFFREYELLEAPAEEFRHRELRRLRTVFPHIQYGVGDEPSDARAYFRAGVSPILLGESSDTALPPNTRLAPSWTDVRQAILDR
jgi:phosphatidate phosphatase PAH1